MRTLDDHYVSDLSGLCEQHELEAFGLIVQVIDGRVGPDEEPMSEARKYLEEKRAECVEQCGRVSE